ncbi:MAG TPA: type II and III secretion system protein family protein, partial [Beijerinckiaceae bacterium]|nr:type II and III secretion system protein family protein [Beijerinckiaceae bacterium]
VVRSTRKIFVIGMENGATSIFVVDAEGRQIAAFEVTVGRDLAALRNTLRVALPASQVEVRPAGDSILLTGMVSSAAEAQQAVDIANAFVGVSGGLFGATKGAVVNSLTIKGRDQVMLRVTVAEVSRNVLKQLGVDISGSWSAFDFSSVNPFPLQRQILSNTLLPGDANVATGISSGNFNAQSTLRAFERAGVSRIIAEPTLTAISGETAKFTAGGEVPIPKSQDCATDAVGRRTCTIGVEHKPFGVTLTFTPLVLSENRISMRVNTEVTELDFENTIRFDVVNIPAFRVRKSDTTVELPSGAVMMTAGLIQQASSQVINGLPGLMNLPVLGSLFRSRDYQRKETELMILVSPFVAKPMTAAQVKRPDDGFVEPDDAQTVLLGRLNKLYGVAGAVPSKSYKGNFGFITD